LYREATVLREKPKLNLGLNAFEELFMDKEELLESLLPKIYDIPINLIDDFPAHPFKVKMDEDMEYLITSIKEQGLITPVILRPKKKGRYEMISGHRRKEACVRAGLAMIKAEVREMTQDEAIILMVDSNLQRTVILPSEKAFSYKMRLEAIKRQGKRTDLTCDPLGHKFEGVKSVSAVANNSTDSKTQVQRYIRLTELIPELLDLVD
jgi:ParB family chromosome partitioning protein